MHLFIQRRYDDRKIAELNFKSEQRWAAVAVKDYFQPEITRIYVKGAPEDILRMCSLHENQGQNYNNGDSFLNFDFDRDLGDVQELGRKGLRCISYAYKQVQTAELQEYLGDD